MARLKRPALLAVVLLLGLTGASCSVVQYFTDQKAVPLEAGAGQSRTPIYRQGEWIIARAAMHNHTIYSDGSRTPEDLVELARQEGMAILSFNDHQAGDICIGRSGVCLPVNGVEKYGYDAYLDHIGRVKASSKDVIVLKGLEVMPWFYQAGRAPNFVVVDQNVHFTVYGIDDPEVLMNMPVRRGVEGLKPEFAPGPGPYQAFVDYIVEHGGVVHAVHVESTTDMWVAGSVHVMSFMRPYQVRDLRGLTGFSVLPEGYEIAGAPGGHWDAALIEYLVGGRDTAPWAMGDADYHGPRGGLARATTLFYLKEFTEHDVYRCLHDGRMVALMGASFQDSYVSEFSVAQKGRRPADDVMLGRKVTLSGPPLVRFSLDHDMPDVRARLIRNGRVVLEIEGVSFEYLDREAFEEGLPVVYRVELVGPRTDAVPPETWTTEAQSELFTNPVFVYFGD